MNTTFFQQLRRALDDDTKFRRFNERWNAVDDALTQPGPVLDQVQQQATERKNLEDHLAEKGLWLHRSNPDP